MTVPTTVSRAAMRARSRWRVIWSRMMSVCSLHLLRQRILGARRRLVHDDGERRLQRVREIADMGARALDDFAIGVEQRIGFARERRDLDREIAFQPLGIAGADRGELFGNALERRQPEPDLESGGEKQDERETRRRSATARDRNS